MPGGVWCGVAWCGGVWCKLICNLQLATHCDARPTCAGAGAGVSFGIDVGLLNRSGPPVLIENSNQAHGIGTYRRTPLPKLIFPPVPYFPSLPPDLVQYSHPRRLLPPPPHPPISLVLSGPSW